MASAWLFVFSGAGLPGWPWPAEVAEHRPQDASDGDIFEWSGGRESGPSGPVRTLNKDDSKAVFCELWREASSRGEYFQPQHSRAMRGRPPLRFVSSASRGQPASSGWPDWRVWEAGGPHHLAPPPLWLAANGLSSNVSDWNQKLDESCRDASCRRTSHRFGGFARAPSLGLWAWPAAGWSRVLQPRPAARFQGTRPLLWTLHFFNLMLVLTSVVWYFSWKSRPFP